MNIGPLILWCVVLAVVLFTALCGLAIMLSEEARKVADAYRAFLSGDVLPILRFITQAIFFVTCWMSFSLCLRTLQPHLESAFVLLQGVMVAAVIAVTWRSAVSVETRYAGLEPTARNARSSALDRHVIRAWAFPLMWFIVAGLWQTAKPYGLDPMGFLALGFAGIATWEAAGAAVEGTRPLER